MHHDGDIGISVEAFKLLPRRLAPVNDGVRMGLPVVGLRGYLHVDIVEHRPNSSHHGIEFSPLDFFLYL